MNIQIPVFRLCSPVLLYGAIVLSFLLVSCSSGDQETLSIGDRAPGFSLRDLDGRPVRLADYAGLPVVLRFFLTDCKFCRADTPILNAYYDRYRDRGLGMLYIDTLGIETKTLRQFAGEFNIAFPVVRDPQGNVGKLYKVRALPQTIILDPDHKIIAAILGGISEAELDRLLLPYLDR